MEQEPKIRGHMSQELASQLDQHEAGVADLLAAYEVSEQAYFAAVNATAQYARRPVASDSTNWILDANLG